MRFFKQMAGVSRCSRASGAVRRRLQASRPSLEGLECRDLKTVSISYNPVTLTATIIGSDYKDTATVVIDKHGTASVWDDQFKLSIVNDKGEKASLTLPVMVNTRTGSYGPILYTSNTLAHVDCALYGGNDVYENKLGVTSYVQGGAGNDTITTGTGNDTIYGGADDDMVNAGGGDDVVYGYTPAAGSIVNDNDTLYGQGGNDTIYGGGGNDTIEGGVGRDVIEGNDGADVIFGDDSSNWYAGDADTIDGGAGEDWLIGQGGNDIIHGGSQNDNISGGYGNDVLHGDGGDDYLEGNEDSDWVYGDAGFDEGFGDNSYDPGYWHKDDYFDFVIDTEKHHV
jgi:hypothetical protein